MTVVHLTKFINRNKHVGEDGYSHLLLHKSEKELGRSDEYSDRRKTEEKEDHTRFWIDDGVYVAISHHHRFDPIIDGFSKHIFNGISGFLGDHN
jgi:hypothetical protein